LLLTQLGRWELCVFVQTSAVFYILGATPAISVQAKQLRTVQGERLMRPEAIHEERLEVVPN
jgi:hypothetical protein